MLLTVTVIESTQTPPVASVVTDGASMVFCSKSNRSQQISRCSNDITKIIINSNNKNTTFKAGLRWQFSSTSRKSP